MTPDPSSDAIAAFLHANPGWLAERPALYATLHPPRRVHGPVLADHMAATITASRQAEAAARAELGRVVEAGRAAQGLAARVHTAVLALQRAEDLAECVATELPALLGVDAACLCGECLRPAWRPLATGTVDHLLGQRAAIVRARPEDAHRLHAEAACLAEADALVRVPGPPFPALLALASRDAQALCGHATEPLAFLGEALGTLLTR